MDGGDITPAAAAPIAATASTPVALDFMVSTVGFPLNSFQ
jgi:hypothetical protein